MCFYATATSSSLLVVYLAALFARRINLRARMARLCGGWRRQPQNDTLLLHTLPYYLAITRSSCEVKSRHSLYGYNLQLRITGLHPQHSHWSEHYQNCKRCGHAWRLLVEIVWTQHKMEQMGKPCKYHLSLVGCFILHLPTVPNILLHWLQKCGCLFCGHCPNKGVGLGWVRG